MWASEILSLSIMICGHQDYLVRYTLRGSSLTRQQIPRHGFQRVTSDRRYVDRVCSRLSVNYGISGQGLARSTNEALEFLH